MVGPCSHPGRIGIQKLKMTERDKEGCTAFVLHLSMIRHSSLLGKGRKTVGSIAQRFYDLTLVGRKNTRDITIPDSDHPYCPMGCGYG